MKKILMLLCLFCLSGCYVVSDGSYFDTPYYGGYSYSAPRSHHHFRQSGHHSIPLSHHSHSASRPSHGIH